MSNKLYEENDIQNIANAIRNKNGTEDTYKVSQMSTAINSIEVIEQATAEGESLNLTNTKAMPYKDYVVKGKSEQEGEPSPSNPSEIHSVADDVNLIDETLISADIYGLKWEFDSNTKKVKIYGTATNTYSQTLQYNCNIKAGTYKFTPFGNTSLRYNMWLFNANGQLIGNTKLNNPVTISETATKFCLFVEGLTSGTTYNENMNFKLQKGTTATPYSKYGKGTVTIKQRGKNAIINEYGIGSSYIIWNLDISKLENSMIFSGIFNKTNNSTIYFQTSGGVIDGGSISTVANQKVEKTITLSNEDLNKILNSTYVPRIQIYGGDYSDVVYSEIMYRNINTSNNYEPYQTPHDYTIQTDPLRSLPNGVKDSKDTKQHRRVGRVVLDGSENWSLYNTSGSINQIKINITNNYEKYSGITMKSNSMMCNNFLPINYGGYWNQNNTILFAVEHQLFIQTEMDLNTFKVWLSTHNTEVLYELAEEIIEPLTQNQATTMLDIIKTGSYEGTTNIYTDEDVKPTIGVGYYKKG